MFKVTQPGSFADQDLEMIAHQLNTQLGGVMQRVTTPRTPMSQTGGAQSKLNYQKSYAYAKENIKAAMREPNYWPAGMKHPSEYRKFYMADDLSFCGFSKNLNGVVDPQKR